MSERYKVVKVHDLRGRAIGYEVQDSHPHSYKHVDFHVTRHGSIRTMEAARHHAARCAAEMNGAHDRFMAKEED